MCTFLTGAEQVWNVGEKNLHAREKERWILGFYTLGWEFVPCAAGNKERDARNDTPEPAYAGSLEPV